MEHNRSGDFSTRQSVKITKSPHSWRIMHRFTRWLRCCSHSTLYSSTVRWATTLCAMPYGCIRNDLLPRIDAVFHRKCNSPLCHLQSNVDNGKGSIILKDHFEEHFGAHYGMCPFRDPNGHPCAYNSPHSKAELTFANTKCISKVYTAYYSCRERLSFSVLCIILD